MPHPHLRRLVVSTIAVALAVPALAITASAAATPASPGKEPMAKLTSQAKSELADGGRSDFWVRFAPADLSAAAGIADRSERGRAVVDALKASAASAQRDVRGTLAAAGADYTAYWATNAVLVRHGSLSLATTLAQQSEVTQIRATTSWTQEVPVTTSGAWKDTGVVPWGVQAIHADDAWADGVTGRGITVANLDTGVDVNHEAVHDSYRGLQPDGSLDNDYNFYDVAGECPSSDPCDALGHGTHTMGTMVGSAPGHQIGVAPGAKWIAVNGCAGTECSDLNLVRSAQWLLAPTRVDGTDPDPDRRPDVINNSWSGEPGSSASPFFDEVLRAWDASGIFSTWSIGNSGPACGTAAAPGGRTRAYSVGAYGHTGDLAFFSSRGPGQDGLAKPDITAPGMGVVSAAIAGGYIAEDGTSMAAPHVSGAVALLWSARPELVGDLQTTRDLLDRTAHDVDDTSCGGTAADNPSWGQGYLDATALLAAAPTTFATVTGTVVGTAGARLSGVTISAAGDLNRTGDGRDDGTFSLPLRPATYEVTISAFGYLPATRTVVVTTESGAVDLGTITLDPAPRHTVSGTLTQPGGFPVQQTRVSLGSRISPVTTDDEGAFRFADVPEGTYTISVESDVCGDHVDQRVVVNADETVALTQEPLAQTGYVGCRSITGGFRTGTEEHTFAGPTTNLVQQLPFAFPWFGHLVRTAVISPKGFVRFDPAEDDPRATYPGDNNGFPDWRLTASVAPFFDALKTAAVYTDLATVNGEPAYVIEWRDATLDPAAHAGATGTIDFSVTLTASGDAIVGWGPGVGTDPLTSGSSASIGLQSATGTDGLLTTYAWGVNQPVAAAGRGFIMDALPSGFLRVALTDAADHLPLAGATVTATDADGAVATLTTGKDGIADAQLPLGTYTVAASARGYVAQTRSTALTDPGRVETLDAALQTGRAHVTSAGLSPQLSSTGTATGTITVANTGTAPMTVSFAETALDPAVATSSPVVPDLPAVTPAAGTTGGSTPPSVRRTRVVSSFAVDRYVSIAGVATDGTSLWTNELYGTRIARYGFGGSSHGEITAPYERTSDLTFSGDLAYDTRTGQLCEAIHGEGGGEIRCYSRTDGSVTSILHGSWEVANPGGLAYNAEDDVFYLGSDHVFTVAGTTHPNPGQLLHSCHVEDPDIRGLAYNASTGQLWVSLQHQDYPGVRSPRENRLIALSPQTCEITSRAEVPASIRQLGGLDIDPAGRLWVAERYSKDLYLLDVDDVVARDVPWLTVPTGKTTIPAGASRRFTVAIDGAKARPGTLNADIVVRTSAGRASTTLVPVTGRLSAPRSHAPYQVGIDVGGRASRDATGLTWSADRRFSPGGWGFVGRTRTLKTRRPIAGTVSDRPFQTARVATGQRLRYRFAAAPSGTYSVELGFASIDHLGKRRRVFDVVVDGRTVLRNVDPARAGVRRALTRALRVEHRGGPLTVTLVHRRGPGKPLLSSLRITERPGR